MSYNGIGLATVRGSGTNGYVQKNWSHVNRKSHVDYRNEQKAAEKKGAPKQRKPDAGILEHERKRKVEVRLAEFEDAMEEQGYTEDEIKREVAAMRKKLLTEEVKAKETRDSRVRETETHKIAEQKGKEMKQIANALGIDSDYAAGSSFNAELQAERREREKIEREQLKKRKEQEWKERQAARKEREERRAGDQAGDRDGDSRRGGDRGSDRRREDRHRGDRRSRDRRDSGGDRRGSNGGGWDRQEERKASGGKGWDEKCDKGKGGNGMRMDAKRKRAEDDEDGSGEKTEEKLGSEAAIQREEAESKGQGKAVSSKKLQDKVERGGEHKDEDKKGGDKKKRRHRRRTTSSTSGSSSSSSSGTGSGSSSDTSSSSSSSSSS